MPGSPGNERSNYEEERESSPTFDSIKNPNY